MQRKSAVLDLSPEQRLILDLVSTEGNRDALREKISKGAPDWAVLRESALQQRVLPLVYSELRALGDSLLPPEENARFKQLYLANIAHNIRMTTELLALLQLLNAEKIAAMAFKGPVLAEEAYGHVGLRQFSDLDILVHGRDVVKVRALLLSKGYRAKGGFSRLQELVHLRYSNELSFGDREMTRFVDLHWRLKFDHLALLPDTPSLFERQRTAGLEGCSVPTLAADDMLLYLCSHASYHAWEDLSHICDVCRFVKTHKEWDWRGLLTRAEARGAQRIFLLGLTLAHDLLSMNLPPEIEKAAERDVVLGSLRESVPRRLFLDREAKAPGNMNQVLLHMRALDRMRDKFKYILLRYFFPSNADWDLIPLPDLLFGAYYLLRPLRILGLHTAPFAFYCAKGSRDIEEQ